MNVSRAAAAAAVLGGLVWIVAAVVDWGQNVNPVVSTVGLLWFLLALAGMGYSLVHHAPLWLRVVVSVATPLLGYGVWFTLLDAFDRSALPVLLSGLVLLVVGGSALVRGRAAEPVEASARGRRAAR
jgi:hypothetical protein